MPKSTRDQVFISYSHRDKRWCDDLDTHLKPYLRGGSIFGWSDEQIAPGLEWFKAIQFALANSKVAVLLVSPDFLASDFIHEHELGPLLKEAEQGGVKILWVPVRESAYMETSLKNYQAVLDPGKPLAGMTKAKRDQAWVRICKEIEKTVKAGSASEGTGLPDLLAPSSDKLLEKIQFFCGRGWLFDRIKDWASAPNGALIVGDPGAGKSAIIAKLVQLNNLPILAYYFFDADRLESLQPANFIANVAAQIANHCPEYRGIHLDKDACNDHPNRAVHTFILQHFYCPDGLPSLRNLSEQGPYYILLDALDEALSLEHEHKDRMTRALEYLHAHLPSPLRIIATSRDDPTVTTNLSLLKIVDIRSKAIRNEEDIRKFIQEDIRQFIQLRLCQPALNEKLTRCKISADTVATLLNVKANGNFLYAKLALMWVEQGSDLGFEDLQTLPQGLNYFYYAFLKRYFKITDSGPGDDYGPAKRLLQVVLAAQEPLTRNELEESTGLEREVVLKLLRRLKMYLHEVTDQGYSKCTIYHDSFRTWLASPDKAREFYVDPRGGHEQLADFCWKKYNQALQEESNLQSSYTSLHGVKHLTEMQRYWQAVEFLDWLNENSECLKLPADQARSRLRQFAKVVAIALCEHSPKREEALRVDADKLASLLIPLYMTEALHGGIRLLAHHHNEAWPKIFERFLRTQDYVLRFAISEVLGELSERDPKRLGEICTYAEHDDIGHQEVGYHALRFILARKPQLVTEAKYAKYTQLLANSRTYPSRSILGDLLLNWMLQTIGGESTLSPDEIMALVDHRSRFWNPIWRFQRMDVSALKAAYHFSRGEPPPDDAAESVRSAHEILAETEKRRKLLLEQMEPVKEAKSMTKVFSLLESYYRLGIKKDEQIRAELTDMMNKDNTWLESVFEVLFAYPLWEVVEKAASALASIVDDNREAEEVIKKLFAHKVWRVRYGAAEAAFLTSFDLDRELFSCAVKCLYKEDEPLLRGNCAENLAAWILESDGAKRVKLLEKFREQIEFWLKDDDCWVLDHIYRLFWKLAQDKQERQMEFLLNSGISHLLEGEGGKWYKIARNEFLERIEENNSGVSAC